MKKWHVVTGISVLAVIVLIAVGSLFYRFYLVPRYVKPVVEKLSECVNEDEVLDALYEEAVQLHGDGILSDGVYSTFVTAYNKHNRNDSQFVREILEQSEENENAAEAGMDNTALSVKYASSKVGVEVIQTNDGESSGKADSSYSESRNSARTKAEDIVEARKIVAEEEEEEETDPIEDEIADAYTKLKENMTASEYATFLSIMSKLDHGTLRGFMSEYDKEGLKAYLHSRLSDKEYNNIVSLGYKYISLFIEE